MAAPPSAVPPVGAGMTAVVVSAAAGLAGARVALRTFVDGHPGAGALLVVADRGLADEDVAPALGTLDLALGPVTRAALRDAADPGDALAPWALSAALDRGARVAVLLGDRQWVTGDLRPLADAAGSHGSALVGAVDPSLAPEDAAAALRAPQMHPRPIAVAGTLAGRRALRWWKRALAAGAPPGGVPHLLPGAAGAALLHRAGLVVRAAALPAALDHGGLGYELAGRGVGVVDFAGADRERPPAEGAGADLFWEYGRRLFVDGRPPGEGTPPMPALRGA